jgi:hypothetical protein
LGEIDKRDLPTKDPKGRLTRATVEASPNWQR